jgi:lysophospholipase L1-like esterase
VAKKFSLEACLKIAEIVKPLVLAALIPTLAACGGGGGGSPASSAGSTQSSQSNSSGVSTAAASNVVQNIDYYGDSTAWGFESGSANTQAANPAPAVFASQLPAAARYVVRNEGVSRTTACQLLQGTDGTHPDWATQMQASNAKYVFINHAINDQRSDIGESVPSYKNCLTALVQGARQRGKIVILETPNPTDQTGAGLDEYVTGMRDVARTLNVPVVDQYNYLLGLLAGRDVRTLMPDGTHPSDDTYVIKGKFAASEFLKMSF